jgi:hypothetical protein
VELTIHSCIPRGVIAGHLAHDDEVGLTDSPSRLRPQAANLFPDFYPVSPLGSVRRLPRVRIDQPNPRIQTSRPRPEFALPAIILVAPTELDGETVTV